MLRSVSCRFPAYQSISVNPYDPGLDESVSFLVMPLIALVATILSTPLLQDFSSSTFGCLVCICFQQVLDKASLMTIGKDTIMGVLQNMVRHHYNVIFAFQSYLVLSSVSKSSTLWSWCSNQHQGCPHSPSTSFMLEIN